jgi:hypothetical protein
MTDTAAVTAGALIIRRRHPARSRNDRDVRAGRDAASASWWSRSVDGIEYAARECYCSECDGAGEVHGARLGDQSGIEAASPGNGSYRAAQ